MDMIYKPRGKAGEYSEWAVNLYGGCSHGCVYCYVPNVRRITKDQFYGTTTPYKDALKKLEAACIKMRGTITTPVMMSFTSDPYQPSEKDHRITRGAIEILKRHGFRVCVLTKAGMDAAADFDLLDSGDVIASSLTLINEDHRRKWEPNTATYESRKALLAESKAAGLMTWASFEPTIYPDQTLQMIEDCSPHCDLAKIGKLNGFPRWENKIDWRQFALDAVALCTRLDQWYMIKDDLYKFVNGEVPQRVGAENVAMHA